jgi:hypothetical protein
LILFFFYSIHRCLNINELFEIDEYKKIMINNNKEKLFKLILNDIPSQYEDCYAKCDKEDCIKFFERTKKLEECLACNATDKKCFNNKIIGGLCDDCNIKDNKDKLNCLNIFNYGCPNPKNLDDNNGVKPYYIEVNDNNVNSPYNKKCIFCWNILNEI